MNSNRAIVHSTKGRVHGPINRLMSPGDLGHQLKPFVFLDYVNAPSQGGPSFGFHPHSGIATLTFPLNFGIRHEVSTGQIDEVLPRGIEWLIAGEGIWHKATPLPSDSPQLQGFQIWFSLPPSHENGPSSTLFVAPQEVPKRGSVSVLLGRYLDATSPIPAPFDASYLWVELQAGEQLHYAPPASHNLAWAFVQHGQLQVGERQLQSDMVVFEDGNEAILFEAQTDVGFLLGSAARHPHELVLGYYSVHTSEDSLARGEANIAKLGDAMRRSTHT